MFISDLSFHLRLADAIKVILRADEDHPIGNGRSGHAGFAHRISSELLVLRAVLDHDNLTVLASEVNLAVSRDWRRSVASTLTAEALVIQPLAALGVIAGDNSIIRAGVQEIAVDQWRRHRPLTAALHRPRNLRTRTRAFGQGDITLRADPNGVKRLHHGYAIAIVDIDQVVGNDRSRDAVLGAA